VKSFLILVLVCTVLLGCEEKPPVPKPEQLLDKATYTEVFYELELLKVYQNKRASGKVIDSLYDEIFKKYGVDTTFFKESHRFYQSQLIEQQVRIDSVISRMKKELTRFDELDSLKTQETELKE
tara:strand:+ start:10909 stop:11280 length:372 start_codon:yes stop_codon:yes gene_type:complete